MDMIKQILSNFSDTLPTDSKTAAAIARGAGAEEIAASATAEGLHALAGALFEALEEENASGSTGESDNTVLGALSSRLREFRGQLPDDSKTARAIDRGARLEEISEAAQEEGLTSLAAMLMEAEQEQSKG
ncbi:MAG: hypothetical protein KF909_00440 [Rhodocyclaceae bacterium]|nr:hypothetical protein [Rhodocyclaceae bacterium]MCB1912903.1 hypothetical protein [Rhodocyclaceae bacterium]MCP5252899.1 hypothetical protein [Zoogloeaceae bacterium]MCP5293165.1 hypothetical protein [Zoogloeaceae bacterium]MCW5615035.1 hypothetical protein [Rhodocyclaceae bacterium]